MADICLRLAFVGHCGLYGAPTLPEVVVQQVWNTASPGILSSVQWGPCRGDFNMACSQRIRLLLTFFSLRFNNMSPLRCWRRSFNFPEFAGHCLNAFTSHHSCLSPWPPSAVLSFLSSSLSDDTGPPIPTLQVQKGVTEHSLAWTALPGHPSPRPECSNHRQG